MDANPVDVPKSLHDEQKKKIIEDVRGKMSQQGMNDLDFEEYKAKWNNDIDDSASFMIQSSYLIDQIANDNSLRATSKDVDKKLNEYAKQMGVDLAKIKEFYGDDSKTASIKYQITEENVVAFLLEKSEVVEVAKDKLSDKDEI